MRETSHPFPLCSINMTKKDEIYLLTTCAETLGPDSYCGPWLKDQIPFIEHDMGRDILPTSSWSETRRLHDGVLNTAKQQAEYLLRSATEKSEKIVRDAQLQADLIRNTLRHDLKEALEGI